MKFSKHLTSAILFLLSLFILSSCDIGDMDEVPDQPEPPETAGTCYIQLFDGDHFTDDSITVKAGEYANLDNLPGANGKNWTDEADSFIVGDSTTVIVWTKTNFQGDSVVYESGKYASVDEPQSMKVICGKLDNGNEGGNGENGNDDGDNGNDNDHNGDNVENCYVMLFDGDNFKDDSIKVGPGEYSNLDNLPDSDGTDWTDEADSFKVGENTKVTVWTKSDFEGDSTIYEAGKYPSVDEPYSMKVVCQTDD